MKAQGKALELALALVVLVIVVYFVLQLFQSILGEQSSKLTEYASKGETELKVNEYLGVCKSKCSNIQTERDLVDYCLYRFSADLNGDGVKGYTESSPYVSLAGIGVCEDSVPCFVVEECSYAGQKITAEMCREVLCNYFKELNVTNPTERLREALNPGACYSPTKVNHWFYLSFKSDELRCE